MSSYRIYPIYIFKTAGICTGRPNYLLCPYIFGLEYNVLGNLVYLDLVEDP